VDKLNVVDTGAAGSVGKVLLPGLRERYDVMAIDRRRIRGVAAKRFSLSNRRRLAGAFRGADVVVHLAADASWKATWRSTLENNIVGTRNVLEAARIRGVRRVVFASSNAVVMGYEDDEPWASIVAGRYEGIDPATFARLTPAMPVRPANLYGVSKAFGEALCRYYSDQFGISVICLRIGSVRPTDRPTQPRHFATMISHRDFADLVVRAIEAPDDVRFEILYAVSDNTWRLYDLAGTERIGFTPSDNVEDLRAESMLSSERRIGTAMSPPRPAAT
jgi:nucleoside-diphosphate-sugar epimerase